MLYEVITLHHDFAFESKEFVQICLAKLHGENVAVEHVLAEDAGKTLADHHVDVVRITSYNVCYTKLLRFVSVSMPSMRVGTLTPEIMEQIKRVRKTGFTIAPEAGTDRLREVINKGITEADLLATCFDAFSLGWKLIKLYFMIGLPTSYNFV